jgi:hypothetical protein
MRQAPVVLPPAAVSTPTWRRPGCIASLSARVRALSVERELAAGTVSWQSTVHAARSLQLTGARSRHRLAAALERLIDDAARPAGRSPSAAIPPCRGPVREAAPLILSIARRLRSSEPVDARGVAMLRTLICDGAGPCYADCPPGTLSAALRVARRSLSVAT